MPRSSHLSDADIDIDARSGTSLSPDWVRQRPRELRLACTYAESGHLPVEVPSHPAQSMRKRGGPTEASRPSKGQPETFTGRRLFDGIIAAGVPPSRLQASTVRYSPGRAHGVAHHANGQTLHITEGRDSSKPEAVR